MKTTERIQLALSGPRLSPPTSNRAGNSAAKRGLAVLLDLRIVFAVLLLMITAISGCSQERTQPYGQGIIGEGEDRLTLRSGRVVLVLGTFESPITPEEMSRIRQEVLDKAKMELGEPDPVKPRVIFISETDPESRIVAYGFAINDDWVPIDYEAATTKEKGVEQIHERAKEWFNEKVASQG